MRNNNSKDTQPLYPGIATSLSQQHKKQQEENERRKNQSSYKPPPGSVIYTVVEAIVKKAKADQRRKRNIEPRVLAAELATGCSGHTFGSPACKLPPLQEQDAPVSYSRPSSSASSTCPNGGSISSDPSDACDQEEESIFGNADATTSRPLSRSTGKEIAKNSCADESLQSKSRGTVGREATKGSSYRMETEYLPSSATHASFACDNHSNIILTNMPENAKDGIRALLQRGWDQGIRSEGPCHEEERFFFKLKKRPFSSGNTLVVTRMTRNIIAYLASEGWIAQPVPSILCPYDALNFRKCSKPLPKCYWLAMTYGYAGKWHLKDQLCVLGGADELNDTIRLTLQEMDLCSKVKKESVDTKNNWHQFFLKGSLLRTGSWSRKKLLFLRIMERLEERGWVIYVGYHRIYHANTDYEKKVGTWICVKSREWTPENPVKISWSG